MRKPGSFRPTAFDIAYKVGVTQPTVSRALRGSGSVSAATRERILQVAAEMNYTVDLNAARLRMKTTNTIALVIICKPGVDRSEINPFYFSLLGSIAASASEHGYNLLVSFQDSADNLFGKYEDSRQADGLIVMGSIQNQIAWHYFSQINTDDRNVLCWGAPHDAFAAVRGDNRNGGHMATQHLIDQGCTKIMFIGPSTGAQLAFKERHEGFLETMAAAGLVAVETPQVEASEREQQGYETVKALLSNGQSLDGIFAASDMIALGALKALKEQGVAVPQQVAIMGFDGIRAGTYTSPSLSTIEQDCQVAGRLLVDNLLAMINGKPLSEERVPHRMIVRESSVR